MWDWPEAPNERIHIDFLGPVNKRMYIVILDAHSKWADIRMMNNITTDSTINVLRDYFSTWGLPNKLVSDNGPSLVSEKFEDFLENNGIKHVTIAPYHAASNGAAENLVKTFKSKFKLLINDKVPSKEAIQKFLFHYRSTPHCTTGVSPAELHIGRKFKSRWDFLKISVKKRVEEKQSKQKDHFRGNRNKSFDIDSIVMAKDFRNDSWIKSVIIGKEGTVTYYVKTAEGLIWKRHIDQLNDCEQTFPFNNNNKNNSLTVPTLPDNFPIINSEGICNQTISNENNVSCNNPHNNNKSHSVKRNDDLCENAGKNKQALSNSETVVRSNNVPQISIRRSSRPSKGIPPNKLNL